MKELKLAFKAYFISNKRPQHHDFLNVLSKFPHLKLRGLEKVRDKFNSEFKKIKNSR